MVDHVQHIVQDGPELRTFMLFDEQMSHALRAPRNNTTESSHEFSYVLFSGRFYITHFIKMIHHYSTATFSKLQQQFSSFFPCALDCRVILRHFGSKLAWLCHEQLGIAWPGKCPTRLIERRLCLCGLTSTSEILASS